MRLPSGSSAPHALRSAAQRSAASTRSTLPAQPPQCAVLTAQWGTAGYLGVRRRELCAACRMQAEILFGGGGGLVRIDDITGNVSVVDSTLTNIEVCAHR